MKPVACGCGGIPKHDVSISIREDERRDERHYLMCSKCGCLVGGDGPYEEVVKKWNTAMSGRNIRFHTVAIEKL